MSRQTIDVKFQRKVLQYLLQDRAGRNLILDIPDKIFSLKELSLVLTIAQNYKETYEVTPETPEALYQHYIRSIGNDVDPEISLLVKKETENAYRELKDVEIVQDVVISYIQRKALKNVFNEYRDQINDSDTDTYDDILYKIEKIKQLKEPQNSVTLGEGMFLNEFNPYDEMESVIGHPTIYDSINRMTNKHGFLSPELIVLMAAPKFGKTITALNIALGYAKRGFKVYYADCENGRDNMKGRVLQNLAFATKQELKDNLELRIIADIKRQKIIKNGGNFIHDFYPARTKSINDVRNSLKWYKEEKGIEFDLIIWDYLDLFNPKKYSKENRFNIQSNYFEAIALNSELNTFSITMSQVRKEAVDKEVITMKDFAEDFGKAANSHAAFAMCQTDTEKKLNLCRMIPVLQRDGAEIGGVEQAIFKIDKSKQTMWEYNEDVELSLIQRQKAYKNKSLIRWQ